MSTNFQKMSINNANIKLSQNYQMKNKQNNEPH